ncbi:hypothetical protein FRX31_029516 [Thalictrum thalictroides]|uniref:Uncharacterized protein n=1 Tax=Thalictrum thalictroides TaxID=46969 RepID=A0A7J6V717_THATH|nr:hypothetical protein FRX31_029516 [Thalictrum thalictroides]
MDNIGRFKEGVKYKLGNGDRFWIDYWLMETPLFQSFPSIFNVSNNKGGSMKSMRDNGSVGRELESMFKAGFF